MREKSIYKDINQFTPDKAPYVTDAQSVFQSVINILRLSFNEIPFTQTGINLDEELFELYNDQRSQRLLTRLAEIVEDRENRVTIDLQQSDVDLIRDRNRLSINLVFQIEGIGDQKFELLEEITLG